MARTQIVVVLAARVATDFRGVEFRWAGIDAGNEFELLVSRSVHHHALEIAQVV